MEGQAGVKRAKRNRIAYSCLACRDRKTRCDRGRPCSQCVMRNEGHRCSFAEKASRQPSSGNLAAAVANEALYEDTANDSLFEDTTNRLHKGRNSPDTEAVVVGLQQRLTRMERLFVELNNVPPSPIAQPPADHRIENGSRSAFADESREANEEERMLRLFCTALPSPTALDLLFVSYRDRVKCMAGHFVHMPTLRDDIQRLVAMGPTHGAKAISRGEFGGPAWLAMLFLVLALGLRHYPTRAEVEFFTELDHTATAGREQLWADYAQRCLNLCILDPRPQLELIQASLLFCVYSSTGGLDAAEADERRAEGSQDGGAHESQKQNLLAARLLKMAILHAQELGLHRLSSDKGSDKRQYRTKATLQTEMGKRIWWALCFRDWSYANTKQNRVSSIGLRDFTTPLPGNYNDEDLIPKEGELLAEPKPRDGFTEVSFVLAMLDYIVIVKDHCEVQAAAGPRTVQADADAMASVAARYQSLIARLPKYFQVGETAAQHPNYWCKALEVQKWLLQSAIFSRLIAIYRDTSWTDAVGRSTCATFARGVLTLQQDLRSRHSVVDRLWTNLSQSYVAAVVLCEHLIADPDVLERSLFLELINEAISALLQIAVEDPTALRCARIVQALLQHVRDHQRSRSGHPSPAPLGHLARKLVETAPRPEVKWKEQPAFTPNGLDLSFKFPDAPANDGLAYIFDTWSHFDNAAPPPPIPAAAWDARASDDFSADASLDKTWRWFLDQGIFSM